MHRNMPEINAMAMLKPSPRHDWQWQMHERAKMSIILHEASGGNISFDSRAAGGSSFVLSAMNDEPVLSAGSRCIQLTAHVAE